MPKVNKFYGAIMDYATLQPYYPGNSDFSHFVFQQMIDNGTNRDDDYTLIAYAIDRNGTVMNSGNTLTLRDKRSHPFPAKEQVQFANITLDTSQLNTLYPSGGNKSELRVYPVDYYKGTGYIVYTAETDNHTLVTVRLNPSPPA